MEHFSDEALIALIARGDASALEALFTRYGHLAYGLALEIVRNAGAADAIVTAAFTDIWATRTSESVPADSPRDQLLHDVQKRAARIARSTDLVIDRRAPIPPPQPSWVAHEMQAARELLDLVPDQDREALELAYYGCYTRDELATILGISAKMVTTRIGNALTRLSQLQPSALTEPRP